MRMSSVELPDDNDKSQSSASTSPCPSPVRDSRVPSGQVSLGECSLHCVAGTVAPGDGSVYLASLVVQKPHRLLPTNLYVVLFNFKARHQDELDLK